MAERDSLKAVSTTAGSLNLIDALAASLSLYGATFGLYARLRGASGIYVASSVGALLIGLIGLIVRGRAKALWEQIRRYAPLSIAIVSVAVLAPPITASVTHGATGQPLVVYNPTATPAIKVIPVHGTGSPTGTPKISPPIVCPQVGPCHGVSPGA